MLRIRRNRTAVAGADLILMLTSQLNTKTQ